MMIIGTESMCAVRMPVMVLVAPGAGCDEYDRGFPGGTGVSVGHVGGTLFMTRQDKPYR